MIKLPVSKLPKVGTTIFTEMSRLAMNENAINLSQGFPDFPIDDRLTEFLSQASSSGFNQYSPLAGNLDLRVEISRKINNSHNFEYDIEEEITVTAGATQAIFTVIASFVEKDDEVIIIEPAYDCYEPTVELFGGKVKRLVLNYPDYEINWEALKSLISTKTKMIIFNNPNNPTGKLLSNNDIQHLINILKDTNIILLSDEVYENIIFDGKQHLSFAKYPELRERSFIVASFGKLFHITGWKIGYVVAPKDLMREFRKVHQFNVFCTNTPAQYALAKYMLQENSYSTIIDLYQEKRDYLKSALLKTDFEILDSDGTYFLSINYKKVSEMGDKDFAYHLTKVHKVATVPFSAFYHDRLDEKVLRLCFAKKKETLDLAIEKLIKI